MRPWGLASLVTLASMPAAAQSVDVTAVASAEPAPSIVLGHGALPGGLRAPAAETPPAGTFAIGLVGGFGFRDALLSEDHRLTRGVGDVAFAYAPGDLVTISLAFAGRFDRHSGLAPDGDDGYVGDPQLLVRAGKRFGRVRAGGQLGIWVPGKDAPSIAMSATSVDARGLLGIDLGPGTLALSGGFRLDNSLESVPQPGKLSAEDRVSLGVSEFHAVVAGAYFRLPLGARAFAGLEASADVFVGSGAPGSIVRGGISGGVHLSPQWSALAYVQLARVPALDYADVMADRVTLLPYEPSVTGGVGLFARFGGQDRAVTGNRQVTPNTTPRVIEVIEYADVAGTIVDDSGAAVAGAKVTLRLVHHTGTGATDEKGRYTIARLPIGKTVDGVTTIDDGAAELEIEVEGKKPRTTTLVLAKGANAVPAIALEPVLPPGQLRAVVRAASTGRPLAGATVTVEPGGASAVADGDGTISIDLPPGSYKATATLAGYKKQTLDLVIEKDGVVVKNFELRK
jgi:hypothetical protein